MTTGTNHVDEDALNRPLREAAQRWARVRGKGWSQRFKKSIGWWLLEMDGMSLWIAVNGVAHVAAELGKARSARGMTMLLNRIEGRRNRG